MKLFFQNLPEELRAPAAEVLSLLSLENAADGVPVEVSRCDCGFSVERSGDSISLSYARKTDFFRALTFVKRVASSDESVTQNAAFSLLCYMADVSRNAVFNMEGARRMIRYLALMGYDSFMLYAEDTFEIPEYPYFGHMRGRYTAEELRELDQYARSFGVELIPCIQTLAHLTSALRWDAFDDVKDTADILLAGEEKTYEFIDKMLFAVSSSFQSRRIHIGMDEAHFLGLGKYLDRNGYQNRFDILSGHLARVKDLCDKYGLQPMIWSDMYFRLSNNGKYYMSEGRISPDVLKNVPKGVGMVYWDYYTEDVKLLDNMFECHKDFDGPLIFAGGAWKWSGFAAHNRISYRRCNIHADACVRHGCNEVIVTGWGDNGGEASQYSILPSLAVYAERCYDPTATDASVASHFEEVFGLSVDDFFAMDLANDLLGVTADSPKNPCKYLLYNAPLNGLFDAYVPQGISNHYLNSANELLKRASHPEFGYLFSSLAALCYVLEKKADLSVNLRRAYEEGKKDTLLWYAEKEIPEILSRLDDFIVLFRQQWYTENKTFGFDIQEIRLGGLKETIRSAAIRIKSYCNGEFDRIEELEQPVLPYLSAARYADALAISSNTWKHMVTACVI